MAITTINIGAAPNDGTGDVHRTAFDKINHNDDDLDRRKAEKDYVDQELSAKADQTALDALSVAIGEKADQTNLDALETEVDNKASQVALDALSDAVALKANQSAVSDLAELVAGKASQEDLNALQAEVERHETRIEALEASTGIDLEALAGTGLKVDQNKLAADVATGSEIGVGEANKLVDAKGLHDQIATPEDIQNSTAGKLVDASVLMESVATLADIENSTAGKLVDSKLLSQNYMMNAAGVMAIGSTRMCGNISASPHTSGQIVAGSALGLVSMWVVKSGSSLGGGVSGTGIAGSWMCLNGGVAENGSVSVGIGLYRRVL